MPNMITTVKLNLFNKNNELELYLGRFLFDAVLNYDFYVKYDKQQSNMAWHEYFLPKPFIDQNKAPCTPSTVI